MNSRERIAAACNHEETEVLPVDFGGCLQAGLHVSVVYRLRQALGLDEPGVPVKVVEVYQMLGEIAPDLQAALGVDVVPLLGTGTMFGFAARDFKEWRMPDGTPVLVPGGFNTEAEANGDVLQYPQGDRTVRPSGRMPRGGHFFDAIIRQGPIDDDRLDVQDNLEEFVPVEPAELEHYRLAAQRLFDSSDKALLCSFGGLTFGDIALVPGTFLEDPKGIRDVEEWYVSTLSRQDYIHAIFEYQAEIALENLEKLYLAVGDRVSVIQTNGTDFGTQSGPFLSAQHYCDLFQPYQRRLNDWIHRHTPWKSLMHCCGGIEPLIPHIISAGFDILNPVQCSAAGMGPKELKRRFGKDLTFWGGGVDTQKTLPFGTPQEVRDQVKERIEIFADGGGFVFTSVHNVLAECPTANVLALFETLRAYR